MKVKALYALSGLILVLFPLVKNLYFINLGTQVLIFALFAISFNLLLGYTGMLSFGHAIFFGFGAYSMALIFKSTPVHFIVAFLATMGITIMFAFLVGFFCVRLGGAYFAMLTLAFSQLVFAIAFKWREITGGDDGMPVQMPPTQSFIPGLDISVSNPFYYYYFTLLVVTLSALILRKIVNSRFGIIIQAIRENQERCAFVGLNPFVIRWIVFIISGIFASLAGALYAPFKGFISPDVLSMGVSGEALYMTLIGGMSSFFGPFFGAIILILMNNLASSYTRYWLILVGGVFVSFVLFIPEGIMGIVSRKKSQIDSSILAKEIQDWTSLR